MRAPVAALSVSTPGRVCLFGEHQDYLGLPVVACAISLRIRVDARRCDGGAVEIDLPDIGERESFPLGAPLPYVRDRDYFRSAVNILLREGLTFTGGLRAAVHGEIPINSGTSSSSALVVSWINLLAGMSDQRLEPGAAECARLAHMAEVLEFGEPGGMMDHCAAAYGGVTAIDFLPRLAVTRVEADLGTFVLGDSLEPKDTTRILADVKNRVLDAVRVLKGRDAAFALGRATLPGIESIAAGLSPAQLKLLGGTLRNREITAEARSLLASRPLDRPRMGALLSEHQAVLRDILGISTPKIDRMLRAAVDAGALGGKINGSGGGGCMFAYAPEDPEGVARAIAGAGGTPYIVRPDEGTRREGSR